MNLKDYLRIFRRRLFWFLGTAGLVFGLIMAYFLLTQKPVYTAKTRVLIEAPAQWGLVAQIPARPYLPPNTISTWQNLITASNVKNGALERMRKKRPAYPDTWLRTVSAAPEGTTNIVVVTAQGGTTEEAADLANAIAAEAAAFSAEMANSHIRDTLKAAKDQLAEEERRERQQAAEISRIREEVRTSDPRADCERIQQEHREGEARIRDLNRKIEALSLRVERIRRDRFIGETFSRQDVPMLPPEQEHWVRRNDRVQRVTGELEQLQRELSIAERRYDRHHDAIRKILRSIEEKKRDLDAARAEAMKSVLDQEEMAVLSDIQLARDEINAIQKSAQKLQSEMDRLSPFAARYDDSDRKRKEIETKIRSMSASVSELEPKAKVNEGFIRLLSGEEAKAGSAVGVSSQAQRFWPMGLLIALIFGAAMAYLREMLDTTLRTDYDVKRHLNLPVLSDLPEVNQNDLMILGAAEGSFMTEKFDTLATILQTGDRPVKSVLVTSSVPEEGKTTVSVNLAIALARQGRRTLLIDGDMRVPSVHNAFRLNNTVGFSDLLQGTIPFEPETAGFAQEAGLPNLHVCVSGTRPDNPYALLDAQRLEVVLEAAKQHYDIVLLDSPPILRTGDALKIAAQADSTLLVIESGRTDMREATWAKRLLENVGAKMAGVLLNKAGGAREQYYYYYSYYAYRPRSERSV